MHSQGQKSSDVGEIAPGQFRVSHWPVASHVLPTGPPFLLPLTLTERSVGFNPTPVSHALLLASQPLPGWAWGHMVPCSQACRNPLSGDQTWLNHVPEPGGD